MLFARISRKGNHGGDSRKLKDHPGEVASDRRFLRRTDVVHWGDGNWRKEMPLKEVIVMMYHNLGQIVAVTVSSAEVDSFNSRWLNECNSGRARKPSSLFGSQSFDFDAI